MGCGAIQAGLGPCVSPGVGKAWERAEPGTAVDQHFFRVSFVLPTVTRGPCKARTVGEKSFLRATRLNVQTYSVLRETVGRGLVATSAGVVVCCYLVTKLCSTLWDPMDCSLPGSSVHGILQARMLERVASSFSGDLPDQGSHPGLLQCRRVL